KESVKAARALDAEHGEAEAARKAVVDREKALESEAKKSLAAIEEEKERAAKLEAEIGDLKKRAAKAEELRERESELNAKSKSIETRAMSGSWRKPGRNWRLGIGSSPRGRRRSRRSAPTCARRRKPSSEGSSRERRSRPGSRLNWTRKSRDLDPLPRTWRPPALDRRRRANSTRGPRRFRRRGRSCRCGRSVTARPRRT